MFRTRKETCYNGIGDDQSENEDSKENRETLPLKLKSASNPRYSSVNVSGPHSANASGHHRTDSSGSGQHCHGKDDTQDRLDKRAMRKLVFATLLCLVFMIAEVVGGVMANSLAIATDAAHLLTDLISFIISLFAVYIASRAPTKRMSFGFYRAEVMGALISTLMIWVVTGVLVYLAIQRVITMDYEIDATIMLITGGLAMLFNVIMAVSLGHTHSHGAGSGHSHEDVESQATTDLDQQLVPSHSESDKENTEESKAKHGHSHGSNINVRAALIHVIGDFIQSIGVFIAALIIFFKPEWKIADPICTFIFSVLVMITTITILRDTLNVLMEGLPRGMDFNDVKAALMSIQGVREVHNLRLWSLTVNKCALAVHLAIDSKVDAQVIVSTCAKLMRERYGIQESTIQVEAYVDAMQDCTQCQDPRD